MVPKNSRVLYISHGGGPLPLLGDAGHVEMVEHLKKLTTLIDKPSAIVLVSAHWEEAIATVTSGPNPELIYDYYGFPEASYEINYPCPGKPALAEKIHRLITAAGFEAGQDQQRGFDHGLFVPLKIMYPEADIPCVQLSLIKGLDPSEHIRLGRALNELMNEDLLIIGSGFSFHNMRAFFAPVTPESRAMNEAFDDWLIETCSRIDMDENERTQRLEHWETAPSARYCHPREEHLIPLHVCYGIVRTACSRYFELTILNKKSSIYLW